jgi:hypothetical protein
VGFFAHGALLVWLPVVPGGRVENGAGRPRFALRAVREAVKYVLYTEYQLVRPVAIRGVSAMSVRLICPECKKQLKIPETAVGKKIQCPLCSARFIAEAAVEAVPAAPPVATPAPPQPPPAAPTPPPAAIPVTKESVTGGAPPRKAAVKEEIPTLEPTDELEEVEDDEAPARPKRRNSVTTGASLTTRRDEYEPTEKEKKARPGLRGRRLPDGAGESAGLLIGMLCGGFAFFVLGCCGFGSYGVYAVWPSGNRPAKSHAGGKPAPPQGGQPGLTWLKAGAKNNYWSVELPGRIDQGSPLRPPHTLDGRLYTVRPNANLLFEVGFLEMTDFHLRQFSFEQHYQQARDQAVRSLAGGRVSAENNVTVDGISGKEYQVTGLNNQMIVRRMFLVNRPGRNSIYFFQVSGTSVTPGAGDTARFFNSIHLRR